jgi:hypothetical protein
VVSSSVRLNHAIHMKLIRRGPTGPAVQLDCADCHRPPAFTPPSTYADAANVHAKVGNTRNSGPLPGGAATLSLRHPVTGRELMAPVKFANACSGCHLLTFDKRFDIGVPHDKTEIVRGFLLKTFQEYIAAHPEALREHRDMGRDLAGKSPPPEFQVPTAAQWVAEHTGLAEELLWRKTCVQCHSLLLPRLEGKESMPSIPPWLRSSADSRFVLKPLPEIQVAHAESRLMPHANFDHGKHDGFTCVSCHAKALTSTEAGDILLPGIATCKICHAPGPEHAESRCFECHTYHDWSKRKEVTPKFTLPALATGSR